MDKDFHKTFLQCPVCGSPDRFYESLAQELKDAGRASKDFRAFHILSQGTIIDQNKTALLPIGARVPAATVATDVCMNCGCVYAVELHRQEARLEAIKMPQVPQTRGLRNN